MHKTCPVHIKATGADDEALADGQFRAVVSVFGNKDSYGDIVMPGAFKDTLAAWQASGDRIPVYWSHQMADPDMNIGYVVAAQETEQGLEVLAQLDTEDGSPKAKQVYRLLKGRRVTQFSFAYDVEDGGPVTKDGDTYYELRRLRLHEVGPTPVGANAETELLAVKAAAQRADVLARGLKANAVTEAEQAALRDALSALVTGATQIKNVLGASSDQEPNPTDEPATVGDPANDEGVPVHVKSEEPSRRTSVATWDAALTITDLEGTLL